MEVLLYPEMGILHRLAQYRRGPLCRLLRAITFQVWVPLVASLISTWQLPLLILLLKESSKHLLSEVGGGQTDSEEGGQWGQWESHR